jgi:hypothetical protein
VPPPNRALQQLATANEQSRQLVTRDVQQNLHGIRSPEDQRTQILLTALQQLGDFVGGGFQNLARGISGDTREIMERQQQMQYRINRGFAGVRDDIAMADARRQGGQEGLADLAGEQLANQQAILAQQADLAQLARQGGQLLQDQIAQGFAMQGGGNGAMPAAQASGNEGALMQAYQAQPQAQYPQLMGGIPMLEAGDGDM